MLVGLKEPRFELLKSQRIIGPELLRQAHVSKAARTFSDALAGDPLVRYVRNNRKPTHRSKFAEVAFLYALISLWIRRKIAMTIKDGVAIMIVAPAKNVSQPGGPADRFNDWLTVFLLRSVKKLASPEERKERMSLRTEEAQGKVHEAVSKSLGGRVDQMLYLDTLATEPASQGRGYGGALLDAITTLADLTSQAIWLQSSNVRNTEFYRSRGFGTVAEAVIGDQNPTWHDQPVIVQIMVREHRRRVDVAEEELGK